MNKHTQLAMILIALLLTIGGCERRDSRLACIAFDTVDETRHVGVLFRESKEERMSVDDVMRAGYLYRSETEFAALRFRLDGTGANVNRLIVHRVDGAKGVFRDVSRESFDPMMAAKPEPIADARGGSDDRLPWSMKGWHLYKFATTSDVFVAVPVTGRFFLPDDLIQAGVLCRGWDEVRRKFPCLNAVNDCIFVVFDKTMPSNHMVSVLRPFAEHEVPQDIAEKRR